MSSSTRTDASDDKSPKPSKASSRTRGGPVARLSRFFREVIAELAKVIWPTRKELVTYTTVVIIFVSVMTAIVTGLDVGFAKLVTWVFA